MEHKLFFNLANAPLAAAGIQASVPMQTMVNISHYPASIVNATKAIPIAHFSTNELFPQDTVAAAIIQHDDGRQQMAFYMAFGSWSQTSLLLCHMWFNWGTRGVYQGVRRLHLGIHIDDVFLPTETADSPYSTTYGVGLYTDRSGANVYRLTVDDVVNLVSWQDTLNSRLANGSDVRLEFAFNMNGAVMISKLDVDVPISFQGGISTTRNFTYKKPLGDGVSQWSDPLPVDIGLDKEALKQDPLFNHFVDNVDRLRQFHWVSHTFSHEELDQCTKYDAQNELKFNIQGAKLLGLEGQSFFSIRTMVTPQITGLFNGDALAAMKENGILAAVGDNSRTNLVSPRGLWFPVYTTMDTSNYDGGIIIPRSPAEVYFSCTTPELNQALYDKMYFAYYKGNSSYEENMQREANRAMYKFLSLTHDPYMFHQANLRTSLPTVTIGTQTGTFSLVQQWAEHVLQKMQSIVIWPVTSLKLDELLDSFLERELREACGLSTTLVLSKDVATLQGIEVVSTASCGGAVTVPVRNSELNVEKEVEGLIERDELGNEPLVIWMDNDKSKAFSFTLRTPIKWAAL
ncbi:hypothetical protein BJ742DRAFT_764017 [Cladochytrium replicatum]|nr:hypothetical protein BJ742DRAFT_764017 [Cladochytrium replicatum]